VGRTVRRKCPEAVCKQGIWVYRLPRQGGYPARDHVPGANLAVVLLAYIVKP
jgi:hypothetical protein